jgi:hypothetical protein
VIQRCFTILLGLIACSVWLLCLLDWRGAMWLPLWLDGGVLGVAAVAAIVWLAIGRKLRTSAAPRFWLRASTAYVTTCSFGVFLAHQLVFDEVRASLARMGMVGAFLIGLAWLIWILERYAAAYDKARRRAMSPEHLLSSSPRTHASVDRPTLNPLDPAAWYYGKESPRLRQSLAAFTFYSCMFLLLCLLATQMQGCYEIYEMPAGGGEQKTVAQVVKIQKIIRKKFIVNPFSAILFDVPPIDEVKLQLEEVTEHAYTKGYGEGKGAGFAGGTARGKVRFIRLEYTGGDWDQDYGIGGDLNMLVRYYDLTSQNVAQKTESRRVAQLKNFPARKSPPFVYMTGQKNISLSNNDVKILSEYLTDKHGMLFIDNGGSRHFHNQAMAMMNRVLPGIRPVPVPLDDRIHRIPHAIPFLPYVAPHGGKEALGWYKDGRWLCYYHPGDIGDAWSDGHAGVSPEIAEACYQLGANVIFYAHTEYAKWLEAQKKNDK